MKTKETLISLYTLADREIKRTLRIWLQTLIPPVITMSLYLIIFGEFIGSQIREIDGFSYMEFIVPGLIMMAVITNSYSNVVSSFYSAKFMKSIEELFVSPTPSWVIVAGYTIGGVTRGILVGLLVTIGSLFFSTFHIYNIFIVFLFVLLTSIVFSLAGMINGILAESFDDISIIPTFILTPLTYLGGVFYSISLLPDFWQKLSKLNPILYMVNGFRYGFLGITDINIFFGLIMLVIFALVLFCVNLYLIKNGVGIKT
ncbi:MAG TPA: ABC transporter permease [Deltaproteobacteria bacterium]|nr:ABC transporter permease [Deltaproteobacteria bacterium]